jgi:transketolase
MKTQPIHKINMRAAFAYHVHSAMKKNPRIWVVVNDLGYGMWDNVRRDFPNRFINVGAAEQALIGVAVGLALEGKIPITYSITSFLLFRPFETIRNYLHYEKIPVRLVGGGRDKDYGKNGLSHWSHDDKHLMKILPNIHSVWPEDIKEIPALVKKMVKESNPWYLNLKRV